MINKPIETYKDLVHAKNTYDFAAFYPTMDNGTLNFIFDFTESEGSKVSGFATCIYFYSNDNLVKTVNMKMLESKAKYVECVSIIDGKLSINYNGNYIDTSAVTLDTYSRSSYTSYSSSSSSSSYSSGGGSSNNNNN
ncbi:MAG: hypothetical protein J6T96_07080 [Bacteroidales bacterium]|nr:hypothetical protein [Bacteroidales bacterium]